MKYELVGEIYFYYYVFIYKIRWVWDIMINWWVIMMVKNSYGCCFYDIYCIVRGKINY